MAGTFGRSWRRFGVALVVSGSVIGVAASGAGAHGGASAAKSCGGKPIVLSGITNISSPVSVQSPDYFAGIKAGAAAVTKSCELGAPVKVVTCDDQFSPNTGATCARNAVAAKPLAVLTFGGLGDVYGPIVAPAGIPLLPAATTSQFENTNPLVFGFGSTFASTAGSVHLGRALGGKKIAFVTFGLPSAAFFTKVIKNEAAKVGSEVVSVISVPLTATDMTPFAAQAKASGADTIMVTLGQIQLVPLLKSLKQDGVNFHRTRVISNLLTLSPKTVKQMGSTIDGVLSPSWSQPPTDKKNPAVKQYLAQLKAAGQKAGPLDVSMLGLEGWAQVHVVADALSAKRLKPTNANLVKALKSAGIPALTKKYGLSPVDFRKPALAGDLSTFRQFSHFDTFWEFDAKGVPHPLGGGHQIDVRTGKVPNLKRIGT